MIDLESSVVVGDQGALAGSVDEPVVPDASGESEEALSDPDKDAVAGGAAVVFKTELAFESVVDGLDALSDPAQGSVATAVVAAIRPNQGGAELDDEVLQFPAGVALVGDDEQAVADGYAAQH